MEARMMKQAKNKAKQKQQTPGDGDGEKRRPSLPHQEYGISGLDYFSSYRFYTSLPVQVPDYCVYCCCFLIGRKEIAALKWNHSPTPTSRATVASCGSIMHQGSRSPPHPLQAEPKYTVRCGDAVSASLMLVLYSLPTDARLHSQVNDPEAG